MKTIADTSIWIDHFRKAIPNFQKKLEDLEIVIHPLVLLELSLGQIKNRNDVLGYLKMLPSAIEGSAQETYDMIERNKLYGLGLSATDSQILCSALLSGAAMMTHDQAMLKAMKILKIQSC